MARAARAKGKGGESKWDEVPEEGGNLPELAFDFVVADCEVDETDDGFKRYVCQFEVTSPDEFAGQLHWERFIVGNEEDPDGENVKTLRKLFGARRFKAMCSAAGVEMADEDEELLADLKGAKVAGIIQHREYEGTTYAGVKRGGWYPIGEVTPGEGTAEDEKPKRGTKPTTKPEAKRGPGRPKKAAAEEEEEEDEEETPPRRKRAADDERPRAGKKPVQEEDEEEEEEDEELEERPRRRRA